jgi:iron(III) transport system substrate-binding protein
MFSRRRAFLAAAYASVVLATAVSPAAAIDPKLIEAAKKEGEVVWYTGLIVRQVVLPIQEAFEKKYGIKVNFVSAASQETALRLLNEGRANAVKADVFDGSAPFEAVNAAGMVGTYKPEEAKDYPDFLKEPSGLWTGQIMQVLVPAINTGMVKPNEAPKTFADLLDPKWKGRMAWTHQEETAGPPGFIGNVLITMGKEKGMEYLQKLSKQGIANIPSNMRVVLDQAIAGQYPLVLSIHNYHAAISQGQGAPVEWLRLETSLLTFGTVSLLKDAPHPNAAKLFLEFLLSEEGQQVTREAGYIPAHPKVDAKTPTLKPDKGNFKVNVISPALYKQNSEEWVKIYRSLFQ